MATLKAYIKKKKGETIEQRLDRQVTAIAKLRKADAAKRKKGTWVSRMKRKVQRHLKSRHSPAGKKYRATKKSQPKDTARTKAITTGLKTAGLSEKDIARFRRKR